MSLYPELEKLNLEQLEKQFYLSPSENQEADGYYQEIAYLIRKKGTQGKLFLTTAINQANTEQLRAIIFALSTEVTQDPKTKKLFYKYIQDKRPTIVAEAIDGLTKQKDTAAISEILALSSSQSPYIKNSALRYLSKLYPEQAFPLLREALKDPNHLVRENAADELGELDNLEAISDLLPLTKDIHPDVRQAAETAIEMLSCLSRV